MRCLCLCESVSTSSVLFCWCTRPSFSQEHTVWIKCGSSSKSPSQAVGALTLFFCVSLMLAVIGPSPFHRDFKISVHGFMQNGLLGIWIWFCWTCIISKEERTSSQNQSCDARTRNISLIYLYLLWSPSSVFSRISHRDPVLIVLNVHLGTLCWSFQQYCSWILNSSCSL